MDANMENDMETSTTVRFIRLRDMQAERSWLMSLGCAVQGLSLILGFRVYGLRFRVWCMECRVSGSRFKIQGLGFQVQGPDVLECMGRSNISRHIRRRGLGF